MATTTTNKLYIEMDMDDDKTHSVILLNPKSTLNRTDIVTWVNQIVSKDAIIKNNASVTGLKDAYTIQTTKTDVPAA